MGCVVLGDGQLAILGADGVVRVLDVASEQVRQTIVSNGQEAAAVATLADGRCVAASQDARVRVWGDAEAGEAPMVAIAAIGGLRFACGAADGAVLVVDATTGATVAETRASGPITALASSGQTLYAAVAGDPASIEAVPLDS